MTAPLIVLSIEGGTLADRARLIETIKAGETIALPKDAKVTIHAVDGEALERASAPTWCSKHGLNLPCPDCEVTR